MNPLFVYTFYETVRDYLLKEAKTKHWKTIVVSVGSTLIISKVWSSYSDCHDGVMLAAKKKFFKNIRFVECLYKSCDFSMYSVFHVIVLQEQGCCELVLGLIVSPKASM